MRHARVQTSSWRTGRFTLAAVVLLIWAGGIGLEPAHAAFGDRITVSGTEFKAGSDRIWINGANTPWHIWNEFGGQFDPAWWDQHLRQLHENGINATRVWISCNGEVGININSNGQVSGCTPAFWNHLDRLFQIARQRQVYIKATLISFDHFSNSHSNHMDWRRMLTDSANIDSLVTNYVVPFVVRYRENPWLWSIDLCNEPDWIYENEKCGRIPWEWIQTYVAKAAVAIHANSQIPVTVGICMGPKYTARPPGTNVVSDAALQARVQGDVRARLDFYSPHYYDWMNKIRGNPFYQTPTAYGLDVTKPIVIGECPAKGTANHTVTQDYEGACENGWQGAMAWTSNGVDKHGGLNEVSPATRAILARYPHLVFPGESAAASTNRPSPAGTTTVTNLERVIGK
jgi:hypothetical protein